MRKTWSRTMTAVSLAEGSLGRGMKWTAFENLSTTVLPLDGGRPVTKSMAMWDQGLEGIDSGRRSPTGGRLEPFPTAHTGQANTNSRASRATDGHQNRCLISASVRATPGWQASPEEWPHWRMLVRTDSGTNNRPSGHLAGIPPPKWPSQSPGWVARWAPEKGIQIPLQKSARVRPAYRSYSLGDRRWWS